MVQTVELLYIAVSQHTVSNTSMTLVSDTFTASTTPSTARIVVFAELPDGTSDFTVSATRDNTNYNNITLTDEGYAAGSSGTKIFTGSTPLTGACTWPTSSASSLENCWFIIKW